MTVTVYDLKQGDRIELHDGVYEIGNVERTEKSVRLTITDEEGNAKQTTWWRKNNEVKIL